MIYGNDMYVTESFESLEANASLNTYDNMSIMETAMHNVAVSEQNWNTIQEAVALTELRYVEETGQEFVYTEASSGGFIQAAKDFFRKIWEKIKELFKKFLVIIGSFTQDDKTFVKKYSKTIVANVKNIPTDATFKGYEYTLDEYKKMLEGDASSPAKTLDELRDELVSKFSAIDSNKWDYADEMEIARTNFFKKVTTVKVGTTLTASEFSEEVYKMLRNGEDSKDDIDLNMTIVNKAMGELSSGLKAIKKYASDAYKLIDKDFRDIDKALDSLMKEKVKNLPGSDSTTSDSINKDMTGISRALQVSKGTANALQTANGIFLTACKEASRQYKAICVRVVTFRNVKESYNGDYTFNEGFGEGRDMFAGVVLK